MNKEEKSMKIVYHVFTDGKDRYVKNKKLAYKIYKEWCESFDNVRLWTMEDGKDDLIDLDCLESKGEYPQ